MAELKTKIDRKQWMKIFTHVIVILMLFVLPEIIFNYSRPPWKTAPVTSFSIYLKSAVYVFIFYANYYVIISKTLLSPKRKIWRFIIINLVLITASLFILYYLQEVGIQRHVPPPPKPRPMMMHSLSFLTREAVMTILIIALSIALRLGEKWNAIEKRHEQLLASQKTEELASLKSQLNPHFLFNTLNTIYALIDLSPAKAKEAVHQLSVLLRYVLYENPSLVKLSQEVHFAKNYISLMEMRMGANPIKADFNECEESNPEVPPLIFISLIENAFKHGNTGIKTQPIEISISSHSDGTVICRTSNYCKENNAIPKASQVGERSHGGIGIANLKRRLQLLYGQNASLNVSTQDNKYIATLTIQTNKCL